MNPDKPWRLEDIKFQDEGDKRRGAALPPWWWLRAAGNTR